MKKTSLIMTISLCFVGLMVISPSFAQFLIEQEAAMNMSDTLNKTSTGPPASTVSRVRENLGVSGPAPAPVNPGVAAPQPSGPAATEAEGENEGRRSPAPPPADDGEGTPFSLTQAAQLANTGMLALRQQRFNEAVEAYKPSERYRFSLRKFLQ